VADKHRVHIFISGRVQGVFFRDFTRRQAIDLELTGWVRNTNEGKVELIAEGEKEKINQLIETVKIGPSSAKVKDCKIEWLECLYEFKDFKIIY